MRLDHCTWPEVERYLETRRDLVVPIGSTEQHGPIGLIGTDALCADALARALGERVGALVAPPLNYGMAQHHTAFPGTVSLRPSTLVRVVVDCLATLAGAGFERFLFVNGHGGNEAPLRSAFAELHCELAARGLPHAERVRCRLSNWWQLPRVRELTAQLYGSAEGQHATPSEVALTQHLFPDTVRRAELAPPGPVGDAIDGPLDFRRRYPDGRMGSDSGLARPEHGAQFLEAAVDDLVELHRRTTAEE
ncbi:MAG TPA: creatininase family protein [Gammaproteobacteria bacterium]